LANYYATFTTFFHPPVEHPHIPDQEKLKKAVRKLRFFLHLDRLPRDFTAEQSFCTKMLWDVSLAAWEEYQKHKDDLDWIHK